MIEFYKYCVDQRKKENKIMGCHSASVAEEAFFMGNL